MATIYNEQRVLGIRLVADGTKMHNGLPVIGVVAAADGVLFTDNQRVLGVDVLEADQAIYNDQPVRGAVMIEDARTMYNGMRVTPSKGGWDYMSGLGANLHDAWDAEIASSFTLVGSAVSAWRTRKNGYAATQALGGSRPILSANGLNGRPCITTNGDADELTLTGVGNFPTGANPAELWMLVDQAAPASDPTIRYAASYGLGAGTRRAVTRAVSTLNRGRGQVGDGAGGANVPEPAVDFSGVHVVRLRVGATQSIIEIDGVAGAAADIVPATSNTRFRIGATDSSTATNFWRGSFNFIASTAPLSAGDASKMLAFLKQRGGIA